MIECVGNARLNSTWVRHVEESSEISAAMLVVIAKLWAT